MSFFTPHSAAALGDALFAKSEDELAWLAVFLTPTAELAQVCIVDAHARAAGSARDGVQSVRSRTRRGIIRSAIEMQQSRIAQLASFYELKKADEFDDAPLAPAVLDLLYDNPVELGLRLDILCRAVTVLIAIEHRSPTQSAKILGIRRTAVEAAYSAALEFLETVSCTSLTDGELGRKGAYWSGLNDEKKDWAC